MPNLRHIRKRIVGVRNTKQVTRAMKMVSAAKLRRAQERVIGARPYMRLLAEMIGQVAGGDREFSLSPIVGEGKGCLVFASDRGLCGSYNTNVIRQTIQYRIENPDTHFFLFGKKVIEFFSKRNFSIAASYPEFYRAFSWENAAEILEDVLNQCRQAGIGELSAIFTGFVSAGVQKLERRTLFPFALDQENEREMMLIEPDPQSVLEALVKQYSRFSFFYVGAEAIASEHAARMTSMDAATRNADDMIDRLTLEMNRARQAGITKELLEIIGGAEALEG